MPIITIVAADAVTTTAVAAAATTVAAAAKKYIGHEKRGYAPLFSVGEEDKQTVSVSTSPTGMS